jgi:hypothetical protein
MSVGKRLQELAGPVGCGFHFSGIYIHNSVYTDVHIYNQGNGYISLSTAAAPGHAANARAEI